MRLSVNGLNSHHCILKTFMGETGIFVKHLIVVRTRLRFTWCVVNMVMTIADPHKHVEASRKSQFLHIETIIGRISLTPFMREARRPLTFLSPVYLTFFIFDVLCPLLRPTLSSYRTAISLKV